MVYDDDGGGLTLPLISLKSSPLSHDRLSKKRLDGSKTKHVQNSTCTAVVVVPVRKGTEQTSCGMPSHINCNQIIPGKFSTTPETKKKQTIPDTVHEGDERTAGERGLNMLRAGRSGEIAQGGKQERMELHANAAAAMKPNDALGGVKGEGGRRWTTTACCGIYLCCVVGTLPIVKDGHLEDYCAHCSSPFPSPSTSPYAPFGLLHFLQFHAAPVFPLCRPERSLLNARPGAC